MLIHVESCRISTESAIRGPPSLLQIGGHGRTRDTGRLWTNWAELNQLWPWPDQELHGTCTVLWTHLGETQLGQADANDFHGWPGLSLTYDIETCFMLRLVDHHLRLVWQQVEPSSGVWWPHGPITVLWNMACEWTGSHVWAITAVSADSVGSCICENQLLCNEQCPANLMSS